MRTTYSLLCLVATGAIAAAGEFINLNFEQANTNNMIFSIPGSYFGTTKDLLPGWGLAYGDIVLGSTGFDLFPIGGPPNDTLISAKPDWWPVLGSYAMFLKPATMPYHLTQAGEIPADALSIEFAVYGAPWKLEANGQPIPLTYGPYSGPGTFHTARGDISAFAGTTAELIFTTRGTSGVDYTVIDNIAFSSKAIPEPSTWALLGLGGLGLWWMRRRRG